MYRHLSQAQAWGARRTFRSLNALPLSRTDRWGMVDDYIERGTKRSVKYRAGDERDS
jgi:hypothetical protein